jgi:hypothetical protein
MIDYFTAEELQEMKYLIISSSLHAQRLVTNANSSGELYPSAEAVTGYIETEDLNVFRKTYLGELRQWGKNVAYVNIIKPILKYHHNIVLMCIEEEDYFMDVLVDYLAKTFNLHCVDLNELFTKGESDVFHLDRKSIHNNCVELRREVVRIKRADMESHQAGRYKLITEKFNKKDKIKKLKELGVRVGKDDHKSLDELLVEVWIGGQ